MHEIFWEQRIQEKINAGELIPIIRRNNPTALMDYSGRKCVRTQEISWLEKVAMKEIMRSHQYLTDTGEIGASGFTDPKRMIVGNDMYRLETAERSCEICAGRQRKPSPL